MNIYDIGALKIEKYTVYICWVSIYIWTGGENWGEPEHFKWIIILITVIM